MLSLQHKLAISCALSTAAFAQSPSFEAASVKVTLSPSARGSMRGGPGTADPGRITFASVTLFNVILRAYDVQSFQVSAPDWLSSEKYDISAKLPPDTSKEQYQHMLQALLSERFHLALHHDTRSLDGFELTPARNGSKLKPVTDSSNAAAADPAVPPKTDPNGYPLLSGPGMLLMEGTRGKAVVVFLTAKTQPISALTERLSREFRMPVLDKTGLTGAFDFKLEFAPQPPGALPPPLSPDAVPNSTDDSAPNLITAVQQQLGLRLLPGKIPTQVLVIDRADKVPTGN